MAPRQQDPVGLIGAHRWLLQRQRFGWMVWAAARASSASRLRLLLALGVFSEEHRRWWGIQRALRMVGP